LFTNSGSPLFSIGAGLPLYCTRTAPPLHWKKALYSLVKKNSSGTARSWYLERRSPKSKVGVSVVRMVMPFGVFQLLKHRSVWDANFVSEAHARRNPLLYYRFWSRERKARRRLARPFILCSLLKYYILYNIVVRILHFFFIWIGCFLKVTELKILSND
jgi:hypothetical protein